LPSSGAYIHLKNFVVFTNCNIKGSIKGYDNLEELGWQADGTVEINLASLNQIVISEIGADGEKTGNQIFIFQLPYPMPYW